jgi:hypothetical protein
VTEEDRLQRDIVAYLRAILPPPGLVFAVPNGGARSKATAGILKATGVTAGVPDLIMVAPNCLLFAEVKTAKGRLSASQREFAELIVAAGYHYRVWRSIDDVRATLSELSVETREAASC